MSIPFSKTKTAAQDFWGKKAKIVKVYVPKSRGFLRAPTSGNYYIEAEYAAQLKLKRAK